MRGVKLGEESTWQLALSVERSHPALILIFTVSQERWRCEAW
jgi:hypothetical protein